MKNVMFEKVGKYKNLKIDKIFLEFENIPVLFSCTDDSDALFLCLCNEIRKKQRWVIAKISPEDLAKMLEDKITIYEAFQAANEPKFIVDYEPTISQELNVQETSFNDMKPEDLPDKDEFLENQGEFTEYISELYSLVSQTIWNITIETSEENCNQIWSDSSMLCLAS